MAVAILVPVGISKHEARYRGMERAHIEKLLAKRQLDLAGLRHNNIHGNFSKAARQAEQEAGLLEDIDLINRIIEERWG